MALLAGCNNDSTPATTDADGRVALQVSGGISVQTRAQNDQWTANDAIGIYMTQNGEIAEAAENRKYTTTDGTTAFKAAEGQTIYFPADNKPVDFVAYYPYTKTLKSGAFALDVSNQTDLPAIDLMVAEAKSPAEHPYNKDNSKVPFSFTHRLAKLELTIAAGTGISDDDLDNLKVEITRQRTSGSYDPLYRAFGVDSEPVETITLNTTANGTFAQAILLPTTAATGNNPIQTGRKLIFTLKTTGDTFTWAVPDDKEFKQGDRNIYKIIINRNDLQVTASIVNWNDNDESNIPGSAE